MEGATAFRPLRHAPVRRRLVPGSPSPPLFPPPTRNSSSPLTLRARCPGSSTQIALEGRRASRRALGRLVWGVGKGFWGGDGHGVRRVTDEGGGRTARRVGGLKVPPEGIVRGWAVFF